MRLPSSRTHIAVLPGCRATPSTRGLEVPDGVPAPTASKESPSKVKSPA